jgi:predicted GIY-YIG superfamily endonuclease
MSDRPTLETDTNVEDIGMGCHMVGADFARRLERERDEAREKYDMEATEHMLAVNKLCNDRDKALKELELIKEQYGR